MYSDRLPRLICIAFGISDLIGVVWFLDTIPTNFLLISIVLIFLELAFGVIPYKYVAQSIPKAVYCIFGVLAVLLSLILIYGSATDGYFRWGEIVLRAVVVFAFIKLLVLCFRSNNSA